MANVGSIATARGEQFTHAHVASLSRCNSGFYVLSGCDVHQAGTPGLSVVVDSGYISSGFATARKTVSGGTLTVATPDGSLPRMDVVYLDTNGTPGIYAGTQRSYAHFGSGPQIWINHVEKAQEPAFSPTISLEGGLRIKPFPLDMNLSVNFMQMIQLKFVRYQTVCIMLKFR